MIGVSLTKAAELKSQAINLPYIMGGGSPPLGYLGGGGAQVFIIANLPHNSDVMVNLPVISGGRPSV